VPRPGSAGRRRYHPAIDARTTPATSYADAAFAPAPSDDSPGIFESIWRYRWASLAIVLGLGLLGALSSAALPKSYVATARIGLTDPRGNSVFRTGASGTSDLARYTARRADFARTAAALERAAEIEDVTVDVLDDAITTSPDPNADVIRIAADADDPDVAARYANAVAQAYVELSAAEVTQQAQAARAALDEERTRLTSILSTSQNRAEVDAAAQALTQIDLRASEVSVTAALFGSGVEYVDVATPPASGRNRAIVQNAVIGGALGAVVAALLAWFRAARQPLAGEPEAVARVLGVPSLGEVPLSRLNRVVRTLDQPARSFEIVATALGSFLQRGVLVVTSVPDTTGRSETVLRVAAAAGLQGRRVLVIDADSRGRALSNAVGLAQDRGFSDVLDGSAPVADVITPLGGSVAVMGPGSRPGNMAGLYRGSAGVFDLLRQHYDLVIIDSGPVLVSADTLSLSEQADAVLVVVAADTPLRTVARARQRLGLTTARVVGFVYAGRSDDTSGRVRASVDSRAG